MSKCCATCLKRRDLVGVTVKLQCAAHPPVQDVAQFASFPTVRPTDFCWEYGEDAAAVAALAQAEPRPEPAAGSSADLTEKPPRPRSASRARADGEPGPLL
jgi:hypothetical protein